MDKRDIYPFSLYVLLIIGLLLLIASYSKDKHVDTDFQIESFNEHTFIINNKLKCFIHDPDCECGGSDLEPDLNLVNKKVH